MNTDVASQSPEELLQAFSATDYRVRVAGSDYVVRPGRQHEGVDEALARRPWAIITAFNPNARQVDDAVNEKQHRLLLDTLARLGLETYPAVNRDPGGEWPDEIAVLIVGADLSELDTLAEWFGQAAIVTGRAGEPARLRLFGEQWPQTLPDWARRVN
ncbi:DUF3293 domain-containing protein [Wenzhouxiangella sp. EGI_FJ10305]|uniref:DUF3293 domain-containing protein n=1 Tax=Wenzhouxiangella sp. EGI_FJ10305 TaxID=3243768 RepID=UPI0035DEC300